MNNYWSSSNGTKIGYSYKAKLKKRHERQEVRKWTITERQQAYDLFVTKKKKFCFAEVIFRRYASNFSVVTAKCYIYTFYFHTKPFNVYAFIFENHSSIDAIRFRLLNVVRNPIAISSIWAVIITAVPYLTVSQLNRIMSQLTSSTLKAILVSVPLL